MLLCWSILHGGPGDAALPLVMKYKKALKRQFTVVVWEQRGAGKSYYKFDGSVTIDFSRYDTLPDWIRRQKGSLQAIQYLWQEVMQTDFEAQTHYGTPLILLEGRQDSHVSSALAEEYFDRIETKKQFYWFEKSCHFPQWSGSEKFNKLMCDLLV